MTNENETRPSEVKGSPSQDQPAPPPDTLRSGRSAWIVIGSLFLLSLFLAFFSYAQLRSTSAYLDSSVQEMITAGRSLSIRGCADKVIAWHARCQGLKSLCTSSLQRMAGACLRAQDRRETCKAFPLGKNAGNFTYENCKQHKDHRENKKICSLTYSGVWSYCQLTRRLDKYGQELSILPSTSPPPRR